MPDKMMRSRLGKALGALTAAAMVILTAAPAAAAGATVGEAGPLQFTSGGHILMFNNDSVTVASASHMVKYRFVGANAVTPRAESAANDAAKEDAGQAPPLGKVTYEELWDGVDAVYEAPEGGIAKSTFYVEPSGDDFPVESIRLGFNRLARIDAQGSLVILCDNGDLVEGAPIAWQETPEGRRAVTAAWVLNNEYEAGFAISDYLPGIPIVIDPDITLRCTSTIIPDGDVTPGAGKGTDFGNRLVGSGFSRTFTIYNDAAGDLVLTGTPAVTITGAGAADFTVTVPPASPIPNGGATNFTVNFAPTSAGIKTATINIASNDPDENPFNFDVRGIGFTRAAFTSFVGCAGWENSSQYSSSATDELGYTYVTGTSTATWGAPVTAYAGGTTDAYVAKLDALGNVVWNTFVGGAGDDKGYCVAIQANGTIYVAGTSTAAWGAPVRAFTANGANDDVFAANLSAETGQRWFHTFLGGSGEDYLSYNSIISHPLNGHLMVIMSSNTSWGSPKHAFAGGQDVCIADLDLGGVLVWNTFYGGAGTESGQSIAADAAGNLYFGGFGNAAWTGMGAQTPVHAYSGSNDIFAGKLSSDAYELYWYTFQGGASNDPQYGMALSGTSLYLTGWSDGSWGAPLHAHSGNYDCSVLKLSTNDGSYIWHTFLGGGQYEEGFCIAADSLGDVFVGGQSDASWGTDIRRR